MNIYESPTDLCQHVSFWHSMPPRSAELFSEVRRIAWRHIDGKPTVVSGRDNRGGIHSV